MSDNLSEEESIEVEGNIVDGMRPIDWILARPIENKEEYDARMEREKAFLELQRKLVEPLIGEDAAKKVEDYYEAGLPTGVFALISGISLIEDCFVQERVLGNSLMGKLEHHRIEIGVQNKNSRDLFFKYVHDFNPDVLYSVFTYPAEVEDDGTNLFVLKKDALEPGDRNGIVERANKLLDILRYSGEYYYHYKNRVDPWESLIKKIQKVSLQAKPMQDVNFAKTGRVTGWTKPDEYCEGGMCVKSPDVEGHVIIRNCKNKRKFGHLKDQLIRYHFTGYEGLGFPYGDMVASTLELKTDDVLKLI